MIAKLIHWCVHNRMMVLLLTACLVAAGAWAATRIKIDAIPDLSDVQVVIRTEYPGRAPQIVEDQVTYPLTTAMLAVPYAEVVRGYSMFGSSFVYVIFEDGTDLYWARSRVLEQLSAVAGRLPQGVTPQLGPDATGVGWVYQYVLLTGPWCPEHPQGLWHDATADQWYASPDDAPAEARDRLTHHRTFPGRDTCPLTGSPLEQPTQDLADLRSLQDWYLRYELTALEGVSEVAPVGGFVKQYQVVVDPVKLLAYDMPLSHVKMALRASNTDVGGRLIELSETEYMVRGLGYLGSLSDEQRTEAGTDAAALEDLRTDKVLEELRQVSLGATDDGAPILLRDVAEVRVGPEIRRGIAEWNGEGETVGGIIVMRFGDNARAVIERVRDRLVELEQGLPPGVEVEVAYDRSDLIERSVETLSHTLIEEIAVVSLVIVLFLLHARSALVAAFVLPAGVLASLAIMYLLDINANIMSLGGIAISIGVMVDSSIVMVENAHKHLERRKAQRRAALRDAGGEDAADGPIVLSTAERVKVIGDAAAEVGPTLFFSLLIITVSFLPIFVLGEQSGRLFKPLAFTKTFAMAAAALLAVTVIPVLMVYCIRETMLPVRWPRWRRWLVYSLVIGAPAAALALIPLPTLHDYRWLMVGAWVALSAILLLPQRVRGEETNPISWLLQRIYHPFFVVTMKLRWLTVAVAVVAVLWVGLFMAVTVGGPAARQQLGSLANLVPHLGSEFMPPLEEGDLLYMPTTDPGISPTKARELLQQTDRLIMQFPEVRSVFGKVGRADTATDPAPLSMIETTIMLHRDKTRWRQLPDGRGGTRPITIDELVYGYTLPNPAGDTPLHEPGLNDVVQIPGLTNAWTMPIRTRIDMLSTGIRTPVGVKVMGPDLATLAELSEQIANVLKTTDGTGAYTTSAFAEKTVGGKYFDFDVNAARDEIARYGLTVEQVQDVISSAIGGMNVTQTVEGRQRYPVNVRYPQELRDNVESLKQVLVPTPSGAQVPLGQLVPITIRPGPPMIKSENARLTSWVFVDIANIDMGTYVERARRAVASQVDLPPGYSVVWSGQYEYMQEANERLMVAVPLAGVAILLLLYLATRSWLRVGIVLLAVPFSLIGAIALLWLLDYHLSLAVWVGIIALAGLDAETGLVMLLYLENSYERFRREGRLRNVDDLWHAVHDGAVQRIRPKTMTVVTTFMGLLPLLGASGAGADTMRRLAAPMIGGLATSFVLELLIYPVLFFIAKRIAMRWEQSKANEALPTGAPTPAG